jgi:hypothetical protein
MRKVLDGKRRRWMEKEGGGWMEKVVSEEGRWGERECEGGVGDGSLCMEVEGGWRRRNVKYGEGEGIGRRKKVVGREGK